MKKLITITVMALALGACAQKQVASAPLPTPPPAPPSPTKAQAVLKSSNGEKQKGLVHFTDEGGGHMTLEVMLEGLKPGPHGVHIHEVGDCSSKDFTSAGGHFNPSHMKHGTPGGHHHAGDLGNFMVDRKGKVTKTITTDGIDLGPGPTGVIGKSVVVHEGKDDLKSQPAGNSGPRILCGVIEAL